MIDIATERLLVRPIRSEDWRAVQKIWADQSRSEYAQYDNPKDLSDEAVRAMIMKWAQHQSREHIFLVACLGSQVIGFINFNLHGIRHEISYGFQKKYQKKGYAREAIGAALEELGRQGIKSFSAGTGLKNAPSVKLLKAVGFHQKGTEKVSFYQDSCGAPICFDGGIFELDLP